MNQAFGCKLAWQVTVGSTSLWTEVLFSKYMSRSEHCLLEFRQGDSALWRFICNQKHIIEEQISWRVRNGVSVSFFNDIWLFQGKRIKDLCVRQLSEDESNSKVSDWCFGGVWNLPKLESLVSREMIQRLLAVLPPMPEAGDDVMLWNGSVNGQFSVKSAYFHIFPQNEQAYHCGYKLIWKWKGVERIKVFMWLAIQNRLPTNEWRNRWSNCSSICSFCNSQSESLIHVLRDCEYARNMWLALIHQRHYHSFFSASLRQWLVMNLREDFGKNANYKWDLIFGVGIWKLWNWRNQSIFEHSFIKPITPHIVILKLWQLFVFKENLLSDEISSLADKRLWQLPPSEWVKLNVDGSMIPSRNISSSGGVLRDSHGQWIAGFAAPLGMCSAYEAEEWALLKGLQLAWDMGFRNVIAESDCKTLVQLLNDRSFSGYHSLVFFRIRDFMQFKWNLRINYISRDQNQVADQLAKSGYSESLFLDVCPSFLRTIVLNDCMGISSPNLLI